ncbi:hypothetical protein BJ742DRAFT_767411 [Cladochytrium replicatum]|nr:hypothetical protein BJ742DRAFT_767411 [Cladochytrium replicatum]
MSQLLSSTLCRSVSLQETLPSPVVLIGAGAAKRFRAEFSRDSSVMSFDRECRDDGRSAMSIDSEGWKDVVDGLYKALESEWSEYGAESEDGSWAGYIMVLKIHEKNNAPTWDRKWVIVNGASVAIAVNSDNVAYEDIVELDSVKIENLSIGSKVDAWSVSSTRSFDGEAMYIFAAPSYERKASWVNAILRGATRFNPKENNRPYTTAKPPVTPNLPQQQFRSPISAIYDSEGPHSPSPRLPTLASPVLRPRNPLGATQDRSGSRTGYSSNSSYTPVQHHGMTDESHVGLIRGRSFMEDTPNGNSSTRSIVSDTPHSTESAQSTRVITRSGTPVVALRFAAVSATVMATLAKQGEEVLAAKERINFRPIAPN